MEVEQLDDDWYGYKNQSGEIIFFYNKKTGEHKLPSYSISSMDSDQEITIDIKQVEPVEVHSISTQTDDGSCKNGCTSKFIDLSLNSLEKELDFQYTADEDNYTSSSSTIEVNDPVPSPQHPVVELRSSEDVNFESEDFTYDNHALEDMNQDIDQEDAVALETAVICEICSVVTQSTKEYEEHLFTHCSKSSNRCPVCNKVIKIKRNIQAHLRTHSGYKPFQCNKCPKSFTNRSQLERHKNSHKTVKPFKCENCGKTFGAKINLRIHLRIHSNEKPFKCNQCNKSFTQAPHLKRHAKMHLGVKSHKCTKCDRTFAELHHLKDHERIHLNSKPFKCQYCDKSFTVRATLKNHERTHTNDRPYKCKVCDKAFKQYGSLQKHSRSHEKSPDTSLLSTTDI